MPEHISPDIGSALEADMERLVQEVLKRRENPEARNATEQELLKKSIQEFSIPTHAETPPQGGQSPLPQSLAGASPATKLEIEYLLDMALRQGIEKANADAAKSSPFVMDAFHDALVAKLYPELKRRGMMQ